MTTFAIAPATCNDVVDIESLVRELAIYEKLEHLMVSTPADFERELFGPNSVIECIVAKEDGRAVGFALYFHNFSTFLGRRGLYLEDLFVRPPYRGAGLGKHLMAALAQIAVQRDCARFEWSVLDWNTPSIGFYRSIGAVGMDEWTVQRLEGAALHALAARVINDQS